MFTENKNPFPFNLKQDFPQINTAKQLPLPPKTRGVKKLRLIRVDKLSEEALIPLITRCHDLVCRINPNYNKDKFTNYVCMKSNECWLALYENGKGEAKGLGICHLLDLDIHGKQVQVLRSTTFALPEVNGARPTAVFGLWASLRACVRKPLRELYWFGATISPIPYAFSTRYWKPMYPHCELDTPEEVNQLRSVLSKRFGFRPTDENPWVIHADEISVKENFKLKKKRNKHIDFYLSQNPNFKKGYALLVFIPITYANILRFVKKLSTSRR